MKSTQIEFYLESLKQDVERADYNIESATKQIQYVLNEKPKTSREVQVRNSQFSFLSKQMNDLMKEQEKKLSALHSAEEMFLKMKGEEE